MNNRTEQEEAEPIRITTAIILELLSIFGLNCNIFLLIAFFRFRYWKKGTASILLANLSICDILQLLLVVVDIAPELVVDLWQDEWEIIFSIVGLQLWYCRIFMFIILSTYGYIQARRPLILEKWFSNRRVCRMIFFVWFLSFLISLTPLLGFGCADIFRIRYEMGDIDECNRYRNAKYNVIQIVTHILNGFVVVWMIFCYVTVVKQLHKIKPKCKTNVNQLFLKIKNFQAERHYRRIRSISSQFIVVSSIFVVLCAVLLIGQLSKNHLVVIAICQRICYTLNSVLPSAIAIKTKKYVRRDVVYILKCMACKKTLIHSTEARPIELATIV